MTLNGSMDGRAFEVFIEHFLVQNLWEGAVVVMDNLPAHKLGTIEPLIQAAGASLLNLSPYSPDFNPIELWWSRLKSFLRQFSPSTTKMVDILLAEALDFVNPKHLEFRLSRSKSALAVRLANSSQERQRSLATTYQTQP